MPAAATPASAPSSASQLAVFTGELDKLAPRFDIPAEAVEILKSPAEFYETLKVLLNHAISPALTDQSQVDEDQKCQAAYILIHAVHWQERI